MPNPTHTITNPDFTATYQKVNKEPLYEVTFSNIQEGTKQYGVDFFNFSLTAGRSAMVAYPANQNFLNIIRNTPVRVHQLFWETCLKVWRGLPVPMERIVRPYTRKYLMPVVQADNNKKIFGMYACKEQALTYYQTFLNGKTLISPTMIVVESFTDEQVNWLREIQENVPDRNDFTIEHLKNKDQNTAIKLTFNNWWHEQPFYRMGWALLACRLANKRENLKTLAGNNYNSGGKTFQERFDEFRNGKFSLTKTSYGSWAGNRNWVYNQIDNPTLFN